MVMKSKAKSIAEELVNYFSVVRQVGHTTRMIEGVDSNSIIVAHGMNWANQLVSKTGARCFTLSSVANGDLRGYNNPLVLDNAATLILLSDLLSDIKRLENEVVKYKMNEEMIKRILEK